MSNNRRQSGQITRSLVKRIERELKSKGPDGFAETIQSLDPPTASEILHRIVRRRARSFHAYRWFCLIGGTLILVHIGWKLHIGKTSLDRSGSTIIQAIFAILGFFGARSVDQFYNNSIDALSKMRDSLAIRVLLESALDSHLKRVATIPAINALDQLKDSDCSRVDDGLLASLHRALSSPDADLVRAVLRALAKVGDQTAIPSLSKLAEGGGIVRWNPELATEALECIEVVRQVSQDRRDSRVLLRASNSPDSNEVLLRPVKSQPVEQPDILLRPAESDGI